MDIYMASVDANGYRHTSRYSKLNDYEKDIVNRLPNILESYYYIDKQVTIDAIRERKTNIFLDSGAFSAHTLGKEIDITDYCDYIKRNEDIIRKEGDVLIASVLDGIGDASLTYENQIVMEKQGIKPLPCFHHGEDPRYLEWYIENYDYICLGGLVGGAVQKLEQWLDEIWGSYLTDERGRAIVKVHGFGITSFKLMHRYPWASCDSSTWLQTASFGGIINSKYGALSISSESPDRHVAGRHIGNLVEMEKGLVLAHLKEQGFNYERLSTVYESRAVYNLLNYMEINDNINNKPPPKFINTNQRLFG